MKLNEKQKLFCHEYMKDFNGAAAAARAGYSPNNPQVTAAKFLIKANIIEYLSNLKSKLQAKHDITKDSLILELQKIAFSDIRELYNADNNLKNITDFSDRVAATVSSIEVDELYEGSGKERTRIGFTRKVKLANKIAAIERLCRMLGFDAPTKVAPTNVAGEDITPEQKSKLTASDLLALLAIQEKMHG